MEETNQPQRRELLRRAEAGLKHMRYMVKRHQVYAAHLDQHPEPATDCPTCDSVVMLAYYADILAGGLVDAVRTGGLTRLPPLRVILVECRGQAWRMFGASPDGDRAMKVEGAWLELAARELYRNGRAKKIFLASRR